MTPAAWNIIGLLANLGGVILLFLFGMPFRVQARGNPIAWKANSVDPLTALREGVYDAAGWLGLVLIILGTAMQILATVLGR